MHRHAGTKRGDFFWKGLSSFRSQPFDPLTQDILCSNEEPLHSFLGQTLCQGQWRQSGAMQNFIGIGISDPAKQTWIGQGTLQRVILAKERDTKLRQIAGEHLHAAAAEQLKIRFALNQVKRSALLRTGLREQQAA